MARSFDFAKRGKCTIFFGSLNMRGNIYIQNRDNKKEADDGGGKRRPTIVI